MSVPADWAESWEALYKWAKENSDFIDQVIEDDDATECQVEAAEEELKEAAEDYWWMLNQAKRAGGVKVYRFIRVEKEQWTSRINWDCLGKYWSWDIHGAGVQGMTPPMQDPLDVLLVGWIKYEDIDAEHGFYSYLYYRDQKEVAGDADAPVLVTAIGRRPRRGGGKLEMRELAEPILARVGPLKGDWRPDGCNEVDLDVPPRVALFGLWRKR